MSKTTLLPAIRSRVGDWSFYVTTLSFENVSKLIKSPDEVHERKNLSNWIQREAIEVHAEEISKYIKENEQRFLGALIIGVYDGHPNWAPLNIKFINDDLKISNEQQEKIEGKLGLLHLSGEEKLFAIDGQHRVAGIKKALEDEGIHPNIVSDEVSAIFVAHDESSPTGKQRTRRLFTTVNKKARRISKAATIALDEDNGFAIVTRRLIDCHWLFEDERKHISYSSTGSITASDKTTITSVVGLYEIVKDLYESDGKKKFESERPLEASLEQHLNLCESFFNFLLERCHEYKSVFVDLNSKASDYRVDENNHLLFRPVGQRAFSKATQLLLKRGTGLREAIDILLSANLLINTDDWHNILWDPVDNTMITNKLVLAETQLLVLAGCEARNTQSQKKLLELIDARGN